MKLGLLGYPITHSLSPKLYERFLGEELTSYELFSCETPQDVPTLSTFTGSLDGLNITSPYKTHFINEIEVRSDLVKQLGAVNTLGFTPKGAIGTNTDVLAVFEILKRHKEEHPKLLLILLGDGVMARVTKIVAKDLGLKLLQFSRRTHPEMARLDVREFKETDQQILIINSCSRSFNFSGEVSGDEIFWDYNYALIPHQNSLPSRVKSYQDGQEMLELQALEAIKFWKEVIPKLK